MSICPYVRPQKVYSISMTIRMYVESMSDVRYDCMQYDPIQCLGHETFKVGNPSIFNSYLLRHLQWKLATDRGF